MRAKFGGDPRSFGRPSRRAKKSACFRRGLVLRVAKGGILFKVYRGVTTRKATTPPAACLHAVGAREGSPAVPRCPLPLRKPPFAAAMPPAAAVAGRPFRARGSAPSRSLRARKRAGLLSSRFSRADGRPASGINWGLRPSLRELADAPPGGLTEGPGLARPLLPRSHARWTEAFACRRGANASVCSLGGRPAVATSRKRPAPRCPSALRLSRRPPRLKRRSQRPPSGICLVKQYWPARVGTRRTADAGGDVATSAGVHIALGAIGSF